METLLARPLLAKKQNVFLPINETDYIEFYVGNAKQAAHYYITAFGFKALAYAGPETGMKDKVSYVIRQRKITFVFTTALRMSSPIAEHVFVHGDSVKAIAFKVDHAADAFYQTMERGAKKYLEPETFHDNHGQVVISGIHTYGETVHLFVERQHYTGLFMPGFVAWSNAYFMPEDTGLLSIDHCVGNVGWNRMHEFVSFYEKVMGFKNIMRFDDKDVSTKYSALMTKAMINENGHIKFPIYEPAEGRKKSEVETYLDYNNGEGIQHIALATHNIIKTILDLRSRGVEFLELPPSYYDGILKKVGEIDEDIAPLKALGILVDRDEEGYLLQAFTKPVEDRPTLFFEIIQRKGAQGFGKGNLKAIFEAMETAQGLRGNL